MKRSITPSTGKSDGGFSSAASSSVADAELDDIPSSAHGSNRVGSSIGNDEEGGGEGHKHVWRKLADASRPHAPHHVGSAAKIAGSTRATESPFQHLRTDGVPEMYEVHRRFIAVARNNVEARRQERKFLEDRPPDESRAAPSLKDRAKKVLRKVKLGHKAEKIAEKKVVVDLTAELDDVLSTAQQRHSKNGAGTPTRHQRAGSSGEDDGTMPVIDEAHARRGSLFASALFGGGGGGGRASIFAGGLGGKAAGGGGGGGGAGGRKGGGNGGRTRTLPELATPVMSLTCQWCRERGVWCGWCRLPRIAHDDRKGDFLSEGYTHHLRPTDDRGIITAPAGLPGQRLGSQSTASKRRPNRGQRSSSTEPPVLFKKLGGHGAGRSHSAMGNLEGSGADMKKPELDYEALSRKIFVCLLQRKSATLSYLRDVDIKRLSETVQLRTFEVHSTVFRQWDPCRPDLIKREDGDRRKLAIGPCMYVVWMGILSIYTEFPGEEEGSPVERVKVGTLNRGDSFGELSMLASWRRCCTVVASTHCMLIEIARSDLSRVFMLRQEDIRLEEEAAKRDMHMGVALQSAQLAARARRQKAHLKKLQAEEERKAICEVKVLGRQLDAEERKKNWKLGSKYCRALRESLDFFMKDWAALKVQKMVRMKLARWKMGRLKNALVRASKAATKIQAAYRAHMIRAELQFTIENVGHGPRDYEAIGQRRVREKLEYFQKHEQQQVEDHLWSEEKEISHRMYAKVSERINDQKTHQARRVLEGIQHGTILGFSFLKVSQDLGVPPKALTRWIEGEEMIREKKDTETDREFEKRRRHLLKVLERSARKWLEANPLVCKIVADWRNDVFGFEQNREEVLAEIGQRKGAWLSGVTEREVPEEGFDGGTGGGAVMNNKSGLTRLEQAKQDYREKRAIWKTKLKQWGYKRNAYEPLILSSASSSTSSTPRSARPDEDSSLSLHAAVENALGGDDAGGGGEKGEFETSGENAGTLSGVRARLASVVEEEHDESVSPASSTTRAASSDVRLTSPGRKERLVVLASDEEGLGEGGENDVWGGEGAGVGEEGVKGKEEGGVVEEEDEEEKAKWLARFMGGDGDEGGEDCEVDDLSEDAMSYMMKKEREEKHKREEAERKKRREDTEKREMAETKRRGAVRKRLLEGLRGRMNRSGLSALTLLGKLDEDGDDRVTKEQFLKAVAIMGIVVPKTELDEVLRHVSDSIEGSYPISAILGSLDSSGGVGWSSAAPSSNAHSMPWSSSVATIGYVGAGQEKSAGSWNPFGAEQSQGEVVKHGDDPTQHLQRRASRSGDESPLGRRMSVGSNSSERQSHEVHLRGGAKSHLGGGGGGGSNSSPMVQNGYTPLVAEDDVKESRRLLGVACVHLWTHMYPEDAVAVRQKGWGRAFSSESFLQILHRMPRGEGRDAERRGDCGDAGASSPMVGKLAQRSFKGGEEERKAAMMLRLVQEEDWGAAAVLGTQWDAKKPLLMPGSAATGLEAARQELAKIRNLAKPAAAAARVQAPKAGRKQSGVAPQGAEAVMAKGLTAVEALDAIPGSLTLLARSMAVWGWPGDVVSGRDASLMAAWFETIEADADVTSFPSLWRARREQHDDDGPGDTDAFVADGRGDVDGPLEDKFGGGLILTSPGGGGGRGGGYDLEVLYTRLITALENTERDRKAGERLQTSRGAALLSKLWDAVESRGSAEAWAGGVHALYGHGRSAYLTARFEEAAATRARQQAGHRRSIAHTSGRMPSDPVSRRPSDPAEVRSPMGQLSPAVGGTPAVAHKTAEQEI